MSFLWAMHRSEKINDRMPSPTYIKVKTDLKSRKQNIIPKWLTSRMSFFVSFFRVKGLRGGMTVEASVVLPLFLFFFLHLMSCVEMLRLHGKLTLALWDTGKQISTYAAITDAVGVEVPDVAVSYLYVQNHVGGLLGKEYLDTSPLVYGKNGLNYLACEYDEDYVDIAASYQVEAQVTIFPFPYMRMVNRYYGKVWNGYDVEETVPEYVYVTIYGQVWHETTDCNYIHIEVFGAGRDGIESIRNANGRKYRLCELCEDEAWGVQVYYTPQGECYHKDRNCSSLVRYIRAIEWKNNLPYRPCSKCVKEKNV